MLDAEVIPWSGAEIHHSNCLVVNTHRDPPDGPTVLATVDHYVKQENQGGFPWKILRVTEEPTSFIAAMNLAAKYAREQNVPVILVNSDGLSSDAEKLLTNTVRM